MAVGAEIEQFPGRQRVAVSADGQHVLVVADADGQTHGDEVGVAVAGAVVVAQRHFRIDEDRRVGDHRSEEHTSELQSLMRISYAVFCLKNTTKTYHIALVTNT